MFTQNWYKFIAAAMTYSQGKSSVNYEGAANTPSHMYNQSNYSLAIGYDHEEPFAPSIYKLRDSVSKNGGVILGTGTTAPTINDYKLAGDIISGFSYSVAVNKEFDDLGVTISALYTITNNNTAPITIGEIGLIMSYNPQVNVAYKLLLEHTVLETPVTIQPGGVGQVTYTIRVNYPTT